MTCCPVRASDGKPASLAGSVEAPSRASSCDSLCMGWPPRLDHTAGGGERKGGAPEARPRYHHNPSVSPERRDHLLHLLRGLARIRTGSSARFQEQSRHAGVVVAGVAEPGAVTAPAEGGGTIVRVLDRHELGGVRVAEEGGRRVG